MMTIKTNQEYASLVPQLSKEEYESLKQSIKENGLWVPIVVNNDGVILDGHHRYKACQELGIKIEPYKMVRKEFEDKLPAHIDEYSYGNIQNHVPKAPRKLLLHKAEIRKH